MPRIAAHLPAPGTDRAAGSPLILFAGAAVLLLHSLAPSPLPIQLRIVAALPGVAACLLWWRYFVGKDFERLPFLAYAITQLYLYWGLAAVTMGAADISAAGPRAWAGAAAAGCVVTAAFLLAHPLARRLGACAAGPLQRVLPASAPPLTPVVLLPWLALVTLIHADVGARIFPGSVYYVAQTVGDYSPLLAAIAWRDLRSGGRSTWLVAGTMVLSLAGLLTGMMEAAVQPVLLAMTLYVVLQRRVPWRFLAAGVLIIVIVNPAKLRYRELAWEDAVSRQEQQSTTKDPRVAAERWAKALKETWGPGRADRSEHGTRLASRLDELGINARIIDTTPAAHPYDRGRTWGYILLSLLPRFLYPGKPDFTDVYNDRFAVTFGFQTWAETDTSTSAFPLVADGYWNFGWPGVVFVALVSGALLGVYAGMLRARSWATMAIAVSTFSSLHANSAMALQLMGVVQHVIGLSALIWFIWLASVAVAALRRSTRAGGAGLGHA